MEHLENDGGSGRLKTWMNIFPYLLNRPFYENIFGTGGFHGVVIYLKYNSAHNEFLEILFDFGILIFVFYILFYIKLFRILINDYKRNLEIASSLIFAFVQFFVISFFSHWLGFDYLALYMGFLGYYMGIRKRLLMTSYENRYINSQTFK